MIHSQGGSSELLLLQVLWGPFAEQSQYGREQSVGKYSQVDFKGIPVKRRKIVHLESDGGRGHEWYTGEITEEVLEL